MRAARAEKPHVERSREVQRRAGGKGAQQSGIRRAMGCALKMDAGKRSLWEVTVAVNVREESLSSSPAAVLEQSIPHHPTMQLHWLIRLRFSLDLISYRIGVPPLSHHVDPPSGSLSISFRIVLVFHLCRTTETAESIARMATSLCFAASPPLQLRPPGFTSNSMTPSHPLRIAFPPSRHARRPPTATLSALQGLIDPSVLSSSVSAISKLMTTLLVGVAAAKCGLLDTATLTALSKCVFNIFLPCLMLTNVVRTMSVPFSSGLFYLPMAAVATVFIGLMLGIVGAKLLPFPSSSLAGQASFGLWGTQSWPGSPIPALRQRSPQARTRPLVAC
ncbi:unnamed protein product [Chondrus crispus]|uniref:Uncharacterized protein n=1 Tax=Chondrus crispus TaxID=2769 RepID=R7QF25_CHOCR|nr:unnamed protein product [Chondrus crispus]CDF37122.1 unnamed protein product [Chondrus crispus]|eukprot:XP_005716941.1 unnamed protein product [Chondrus crispus]